MVCIRILYLLQNNRKLMYHKPLFIMHHKKSYETEKLYPVLSFMDELSNSVKNRNNKNIKHPKNNGFMQQESYGANKNA